jgi:hypothetical protein
MGHQVEGRKKQEGGFCNLHQLLNLESVNALLFCGFHGPSLRMFYIG